MRTFFKARSTDSYLGYVLRGAATFTILFFLAQTAYHNFDTFFNEQLQDPAAYAAFDGRTTAAAKAMDQLGPDYRILASSLLSGPALEFLYPPARRSSEIELDPTRDLPLGESRPTAIYLDDGKEPYVTWLRALYPQAVVRETVVREATDEEDHTVLYEVLLSVEDIDSRRGIEGEYRTPDGNRVAVREPDLEIDWSASAPFELPFEASWTGILKVDDYGSHQLTLDIPGAARLIIDGTVVAEGKNRLAASPVLFRGTHLLEIEATITERGRVSFTDNAQPVHASAYFVAHDQLSRGLLVSFYANLQSSGEPVLIQTDPFVGFTYHTRADLPISGPFSAVWRGALEVPETGDYTFELGGREQAALYIDGDEWLTLYPGPREERVRLSAGRHDLRITFRNAGGTPEIYLYWTPPGGEREVIPTANLLPP